MPCRFVEVVRSEVRNGTRSLGTAALVVLLLAVVAPCITLSWPSQLATAIVGALVAAVTFGGGLLEVLQEDAGDRVSAANSKAFARLMAMPATLAAAGLIALRLGERPVVAVDIGLLAMSLPAAAALALSGRWRTTLLLTVAGSAAMAVGVVVTA